MKKTQQAPAMTNAMTKTFTRLLMPLAMLLALPLQAHHSASEFDMKQPVEITGTVTELDWRSPHARLYVDVTDENGATVNWNFELPSPNTMMRRGWKRKDLQPGDRVTVTAARARNYPNIALTRSVIKADGKAMFTGTTPVYDPAAPATE